MLDVLQAIANVVIIIGIVGVLAAWRQFRADHERSRREKAIEYIFGWVRNLDRKGTLARKLVETFSIHQARAMNEQKPFKIDDDHGPLLEGVFDPLPVKENGKYLITEAMSAELRWIIVSYINNLEAIMAGWYYHVADRKIIAEQFAYLISPSDGHFILKQFRAAVNDGAHYPAISAFVQSFEKDRDATLAGKAVPWQAADRNK